MSRSFNYLTVNYPNIPVLGSSAEGNVLGKFIPSPEDSRNQAIESFASVKSMDMYLPDFSLRVMEGRYFADALLENTEAVGTDLPGSCLFLKGRVKSILEGEQDGIESYQRQQNFKFDPDNEFRHFVPADHPFHFLHFSYTAEFLNTILPEGERWAEDLKRDILSKKRIVGTKPVVINAVQERAMQIIFNNPLQGKLGLMLLETAMTQIILIQLAGLFSDGNEAQKHGMAKRDIETIHAVREYLHDTFLHDHSLMNLAKQFGINTNKLMHSFKKVFGKSIFELIQEMRMEHAQMLLRDQELQVTEVARTIGYKNPNHFSAAFKRQFGFCPSELR